MFFKPEIRILQKEARARLLAQRDAVENAKLINALLREARVLKEKQNEENV